MKRILFLLLSFLLLLFQTACGEETFASQEDSVPMTAAEDGEAEIRLDAEDPLLNFLDVSNLSQSTLSDCLQELELIKESSGVTVTLLKSMGDAWTMYLSLKAVYHEGTDLSVFPAFDAVLRLSDSQNVSVRVQSFQAGENTAACLITVVSDTGALIPGETVSLRLTSPSPVPFSHSFQWTITSQAPTQTAALQNAAGKTVGEATLTPFSLRVALDSGEPLPEKMTLLDSQGEALETNAALDDSGTAYLFYCLAEPSRSAKAEIGDAAALFDQGYQ